jgi:hypothetical protein
VSARGEEGGWPEGEKRENGGEKKLITTHGREEGKKEGCGPAVGLHPKNSLVNPTYILITIYITLDYKLPHTHIYMCVCVETYNLGLYI